VQSWATPGLGLVIRRSGREARESSSRAVVHFAGPSRHGESRWPGRAGLGDGPDRLRPRQFKGAGPRPTLDGVGWGGCPTLAGKTALSPPFGALADELVQVVRL
jgi:hypothetical protein